MSEIVIIAAVAENGVIGRGNAIPWRISADFRRFKRLTLGHPCIMGRATYESLPAPSRPLPGRENIVLTRQSTYRPRGVTIVHRLDEATAHVRDAAKVFIIGGASVYREALASADTLELTRVHHVFPGDTHFPELDWAAWDCLQREDGEEVDTLSGMPVRITYETYSRARSHGSGE